jgi:hypothetical protein
METERALDLMRTTPPNARGSWNLNRRAEVLRLHTAGHDVAAIAAAMSIASDEVVFILKVHRLMQTAGRQS